MGELLGKFLSRNGHSKVEVIHQKETGKEMEEQAIGTNRTFHLKRFCRKGAYSECGVISSPKLFTVLEVLNWLETSTKLGSLCSDPQVL